MLPLILLIGVGNLIPKSYLSYSNVTGIYVTYLPQRAVGLETAYEYAVNNTRNSSLVVRISSYQNYTDALNVYNYLYGLKSNQTATQQVPYSELIQEFNFSNVESLESYSEFYNANLTTRLNYSTLYMLVGNSVMEFYSIGLKITPLSSPGSIESIATTNQAVQVTTMPAITTVPMVTTPSANYSAIYLLIGLIIAVLIIIAIYTFSRRRARSLPTNLTEDASDNS
jgi:ATP-dependent Zn protease